MTHPATIQTPALLDVLSLFPNCAACGRPLSLCDARLELDPARPQRVRHADCAAAPLA